MDQTALKELKESTKMIIYSTDGNLKKLYCVKEITDYHYRGTAIRKIKGYYANSGDFVLLKHFVHKNIEDGTFDVGADLDSAISWLLK